MPLRGTNFRDPVIAAPPPQIDPRQPCTAWRSQLAAWRRTYDFVIMRVAPHL
jgi:hypothetical protein